MGVYGLAGTTNGRPAYFNFAQKVWLYTDLNNHWAIGDKLGGDRLEIYNYDSSGVQTPDELGNTGWNVWSGSAWVNMGYSLSASCAPSLPAAEVNPVQLTAGLTLGFAALTALVCSVWKKRKLLTAQGGMAAFAPTDAVVVHKPATIIASDHFCELDDASDVLCFGSPNFQVDEGKLGKLAKVDTLLQLKDLVAFMAAVLAKTARFPGASDQSTSKYFTFVPERLATCTNELESFYATSAMRTVNMVVGIICIVGLLTQDLWTFLQGVTSVSPAAIWDKNCVVRLMQNLDIFGFCFYFAYAAYTGYNAPILSLLSCDVYPKSGPMFADFILPIWILLLGFYNSYGARLFHGYNIFKLDSGDDAPLNIKAFRAMNEFVGSHTFEWGDVFKENKQKCSTLEDDFVVEHSPSTVNPAASLLNLVTLVAAIYGITMTLELPTASAYTFHGEPFCLDLTVTEKTSIMAKYFAEDDPYTTAAHQQKTLVAGCAFIAVLVAFDLYALCMGRSMPYLGFTDKKGNDRKKQLTWLLAGIVALIFTVRVFRPFSTGVCEAHPKVVDVASGFWSTVGRFCDSLWFTGIMFLKVNPHTLAFLSAHFHVLATDPPSVVCVH
jgi:hypothetical protein